MKKTTVKLYLIRALLLFLILLIMLTIFHFSAQDGNTSAQSSEKIESVITDHIIQDFHEKPTDTQTHIRKDVSYLVRKAAHFMIFGCLGALVYLFLLTWERKLLLKYGCSLLFTLAYAALDEVHQYFIEGRDASPMDVLIDFSGALLFTSVILLIVMKKRKETNRLKSTYYYFKDLTPSGKRIKLAVASDLHGKNHQAALELLQAATPDLILIPGDLSDDVMLRCEDDPAYAFLSACAAIAPTFYSIGNHEIACYHKGNPWRKPTPIPLNDEIKERIRKTGAVLLDNESIRHGDLRICGLTSGINKKENAPKLDALERFANEDGFRILLCHHPEYYLPYIQKTGIELTVSGHAHGGQWRFFGHGVYSPGQGIFPKYTGGVLDGRCVISRGMGDHTRIPRICNPHELVFVFLGYGEEEVPSAKA